MRARVWGLAVLSVVIAGFATAETPEKMQSQTLGLYKSLPKDPLVVLSVSIDDSRLTLTRLLDFVGHFGFSQQQHQVRQAVATLDRAVGMSLQQDVLAHLGPEIAIVLDVYPIDDLAIAFQTISTAGFSEILGQIGLVAEVRDPKGLDRSLREMMMNLGAKSVGTSHPGLVRLDIPIALGNSNESGNPSLGVYYVIETDKVVFGFSKEWVLGVLGGIPESQRLTAGQDFSRVFSSLDPYANRLLYVNLPKVRQLLVNSRLVRAVVASKDKVRILFERLLTNRNMSTGIGLTSLVAEGGIRTTTFGPEWSTKAISSAILVTLDDQDDRRQGPLATATASVATRIYTANGVER